MVVPSDLFIMGNVIYFIILSICFLAMSVKITLSWNFNNLNMRHVIIADLSLLTGIALLLVIGYIITNTMFPNFFTVSQCAQ